MFERGCEKNDRPFLCDCFHTYPHTCMQFLKAQPGGISLLPFLYIFKYQLFAYLFEMICNTVLFYLLGVLYFPLFIL